jgi:flagellar protein FliS
MSANTTGSQEYLRNAVLTATPEQLVLMLYEGAIRFASQAREAIQTKDREAAFHALDRAQLIMLELSNGIRREVQPQLADQIGALYSFVYRRLVDANLHQDIGAVDDALRILRYQRETWLLLMDKLRQGGEAETSKTSNSPAPPDSNSLRTSSFVAEG